MHIQFVYGLNCVSLIVGCKDIMYLHLTLSCIELSHRRFYVDNQPLTKISTKFYNHDAMRIQATYLLGEWEVSPEFCTEDWKSFIKGAVQDRIV